MATSKTDFSNIQFEKCYIKGIEKIQGDIILFGINQGQNRGVISEEISLINSQKEEIKVLFVWKVTKMTFPYRQSSKKALTFLELPSEYILQNIRYEDTFLNGAAPLEIHI